MSIAESVEEAFTSRCARCGASLSDQPRPKAAENRLKTCFMSLPEILQTAVLIVGFLCSILVGILVSIGELQVLGKWAMPLIPVNMILAVAAAMWCMDFDI